MSTKLMTFSFYFLTLCCFVSVVESRKLGFNSSLFQEVNGNNDGDDSIVYIWPLPSKYTYGNNTISINPDLSLEISGNGGYSIIVSEGFQRYREIIFKHHSRKKSGVLYDVNKLKIIVNSDNETLNLNVDESYSLFITAENGSSIIQGASIEANTVFGALRGLETFSQLCSFDYGTKSVQVYKAPWYIQDEPKFVFRGLLLDTSRHFLPIDVIKQVIESMSYAKLNVLHWHIIDEQSFPLEVPSHPYLWKGSYTKFERYTVEDAYDIVDLLQLLNSWFKPLGVGPSVAFLHFVVTCYQSINVMAEIDVPGHAESWGRGYPELWPSETCREPLDVTKNFTFDVVSSILADMRKIFPFELFHLGGDEVNTDCWSSTPHVKHWLQEHNMTTKDAYRYFVLRAQEIAISKNWTPVNWEETYNSFKGNLNPRTVVHNWLGPGVCPKAAADGFRCIYSNQGVWYLDHLDVPWEDVYKSEPLEGISDGSHKKLVLGGEVCMWGETADSSDVQQTIWPRAAAAAERMWSSRDMTSARNMSSTVLPRLEYFRCLLNRRGVPAAPVNNYYARRPPVGPGSCYLQ
ncbi:hypothetical protein C5167_000979 [Papaver somniferum]|uniref:Beta-hexosaminidase n=1 Tax=Papaver somniferum TaxID=3469 RepID=A0A4Y7KY63_PAPSO|nr:hypothetical protein C5167_000979 [Papaver somniferum]